MIQRVSSANYVNSFGKSKVAKTPEQKQMEKMHADTFRKKYTDSFINHAKQSTPMLLGLTALWTALDSGSKKIPVQKSLLNNLATFFLPVLVGSSAVLAGIENKKPSKSSN